MTTLNRWRSEVDMSDQTFTNTIVATEEFSAVRSGMDYTDYCGWTEWAYSLLANDGQVPQVIDQDDDSYFADAITLASLGHLFDRFTSIREGVVDEDSTAINPFDDACITLTGIEIGRYAEKNCIVGSSFPESQSELIEEAILQKTDSTARNLTRIVGDARLFTSLVASASPQFAEDDDDDDDDDEPYAGADDDFYAGEGAPLEAFDRFTDKAMDVDFGSDGERAYHWLTERPLLG